MTFLLVLILLEQTIVVILLASLWSRISTYLNWTEYHETEDYINEITKPTNNKPSLKSTKQEKRGRDINKTDDLVDIADIDWEEGYKALEDIGK